MLTLLQLLTKDSWITLIRPVIEGPQPSPWLFCTVWFVFDLFWFSYYVMIFRQILLHNFRHHWSEVREETRKRKEKRNYLSYWCKDTSTVTNIERSAEVPQTIFRTWEKICRKREIIEMLHLVMLIMVRTISLCCLCLTLYTTRYIQQKQLLWSLRCALSCCLRVAEERGSSSSSSSSSTWSVRWACSIWSPQCSSTTCWCWRKSR